MYCNYTLPMDFTPNGIPLCAHINFQLIHPRYKVTHTNTMTYLLYRQFHVYIYII